jgi:hypothetical protein
MALAFVDDSRSGGDSPYYVLAGYSASLPTWDAFSIDWKAVLDSAPKLDYFKMSEAESLKGQFAGFRPDQRDARLGQFIDVVLRYSPWEASIAVPDSDYRELLYPVLHKQHANPYYFAFIAMVTALSGFYRHSGSTEMVDFIFDEQKGMENRMRRLYAQFRGWYPHWQLGRVAFKNDKQFLPLQAADLIAWQTRRFMCTAEGTRKELQRLHSGRPHYRKILRRQYLREMADAIQENIPKLREEYGDDRVDRHLEAIEKRNRREAILVPSSE